MCQNRDLDPSNGSVPVGFPFIQPEGFQCGVPCLVPILPKPDLNLGVRIPKRTRGLSLPKMVPYALEEGLPSLQRAHLIELLGQVACPGQSDVVQALQTLARDAQLVIRGGPKTNMTGLAGSMGRD